MFHDHRSTRRSRLDDDPRFTANLARVMAAYDQDALARVCAMHETEFPETYGLTMHEVDQPVPMNWFGFRVGGDSSIPDNPASRVLAVAHLDTVGPHEEREAHFVDTAAGPVVFSRALDDRLGAYIILELLPALGIRHPVLLTVGEEDGRSTAQFFDGPVDSIDPYNWMIEFDRGGTDVVLYQYESRDLRSLVEDCGARVGDGAFSDVSFLDHLGVKGINWGVGYRDYHDPNAHAYLLDTFMMVAQYLAFFEDNAALSMPHQSDPRDNFWGRTMHADDLDYCDNCGWDLVDGRCEDCEDQITEHKQAED